MTCKPPLYALAAALAILSIPVAPGQQAGAQTVSDVPSSPCGECLRAAARPGGWRAEHADLVALLVTPAEVGASERLIKAANTAILEVAPAGSLDEISFRTRRALVDIRALNPRVTVGVISTPETLEGLLARGLSAYVDFVVDDPGAAAPTLRPNEDQRGLSVWSTFRFESFSERLLAGDPRRAGADTALIWPALEELDPGFVGALRIFGDLFPANLIRIPDFDVRCQPVAACSAVSFQRADTLETVVVIRRGDPGPVAATLPAPGAQLFAVTSAVDSRRLAFPDTIQPLAPVLAEAGSIRFDLPAGVPFAIARLPPAADAVTENVSVVGERALAVEEIVARHQAVAARQTRSVRGLVTEALTTVTFEVPAFPAPVTIQAHTTILQGDGPTELVQQSISVNGVPFTSTDVPRLPLIEPEQVAAPPLAITLDRAYRYELAGRERVNGRDAYVVAFEPLESARSLFRGSAWIDAREFALLRIDAVQTNLRGPITSSQQIEEFAPHDFEGRTLWLLSRSEIRQIYQGAGITTPIHRLMEVREHEVNPPDLAERRAQAYASPVVMLRQTPDGLRYLRRNRAEPGGGAPAREVADRATRVRTLAGGVLVDPNITRPLPFAGLNYTDFDFLGTGAQFNAFYAGSYGQFAFNAPSIAGTRWQLTGSGFGILAHYNDRSFRMGVERYEENVRQRPANLRVGVVRPITARTTIRGDYVLDYVALERAPTTAESFAVPADQVVHAMRLALETQRGGWRIEAWWNPARRVGWRDWGRVGADDYEPRHADFQRVGLNAYRPWVLTPRLLARVEAAWMAGRDLDRFSRYAFGTFDNRLRGYPSASIRYDRGGAVRTALVWQTGGRIRLDGFFDAGIVHDPGFGSGSRIYPGIGAALEGPGPWSLLLGAEWGYGIEGIDSDGQQGTHVVRLTAYKLF